MERDAAFDMDVVECPSFRVTRDQLKSTDFLSFVQKTFREHPDLPAFKIVPPSDWSPTKRRPNLDQLIIQTPIKQLAFGKTGSYRCVLVEDKARSVAEFRDLAMSEERLPPKKCRKDYKLLERQFWKSVTMNPPLYGADTPMSLFDTHCKGWGLSDLSDLLKEKGVPEIPGVTTPMSYFGMWKSFFAWHVEDADLYSVNFLHWGAPKIWYCVPPSSKARFERLAAAMHPEAFRACKGFLRHKDILISPSVLKQYNVQYQMCKQEKGEYVVLNAAAYHSGFNCGFNTAEAVNFATHDWIEKGRQAVPCTCDALRDQVTLDMGIFCPDLRTESIDTETTSMSVASGSASGSSDADSRSAAAPSEEGAVSPSQTSDVSEADIVISSGGKRSRGAAALPPAAAAPPANKAARGGVSAGGTGGTTGVGVIAAASRAVSERATRGAGRPPPLARTTCTSKAAAKPLRAAAMKLNAARKQCDRNGAVLKQLAALPKPAAIVYSPDSPGPSGRRFDLVIPLEASSSAGRKKVQVQLLREGRDGLYRPSSDVSEEQRSSLVPIRTQVLDPGARKPGFKLLTLRSRIMGTELV